MATRMEAGPGAPGAMMEPIPAKDRPGTAVQPFQPPAAPAVRETSATAVAAREKASVEARYVVALNRPRNFDACRLRLLDACQRPRFAAAARYLKPVGRDKVSGFSIRFAEEARTLWGNIDVSSFLVVDDDLQRIYRVTATDLETNATEGVDIVVEKYVERRQLRDGMEVISRRTNTQGQTVYRIRATEDDLQVKANALMSKARRNLILALLPADVKEECEEQITETIKDRDAKDPAGSRKEILAAFWNLGVTPEQVSALVEKPLDHLNPAELGLLRTIYTAIKEGETTYDDALAELGGKVASKAEVAKKGSEGLKSRLDAKVAEKKSEIAAEKAEAPTARQLETYRSLAGRRVWTAEEKQEFEARLVEATQATIGTMIDEMAEEAQRREQSGGSA